MDCHSSLRDRRGSSSLRAESLGDKSSFLGDSETIGRKDGGSINGGRRISNSVQAQIERMFTEVSKDATSCSFPVRCLGSLPLNEKVTSLQGLQEPLRQLYLSGAGHGVRLFIFRPNYLYIINVFICYRIKMLAI